ncbi:MAG: hypothetical protein VKJ04_01590 [Vampirovibrionales bacterium]|nr:hypothetical protein [Vampirovibrionales bacterium]
MTQPLKRVSAAETNFTNVWDLPQCRIELKPFTKLYQLDEGEQQMLSQWLNGPQVEIHYDLNDETDYAVHYRKGDSVMVARVSDCVTINGIRWHLQPGKNVIPKAVYEFILKCPEQRRRVSSPEAGVSRNLGLFRSSTYR